MTLPNTLGMVMHADARDDFPRSTMGVAGTKPYAASGNYIRRMSNYCKSCSYNVRETIEDNACPFNALYWNFLMRHEDRLADNPRMGMMYRNLGKMDPSRKAAITTRAGWIREHVEEL